MGIDNLLHAVSTINCTVSPYEYPYLCPTTSNEPQKSNQTMNVEEEKDPFASFGEEIEISDNDLPF